MAYNLDDYVDVGERIHSFYERFPEGRLQSYRDPYVLDIGGKAFVVYAAAAYRDPDDTHPGIGWAWEPVPGSTPYTRDSELMNAETSAWGRAIVSLGFETKKGRGLASRQEVRNRQDAPEKPSDGAGGGFDIKRFRVLFAAQNLTINDFLEELGLEPSPNVSDVQNATNAWAMANKEAVEALSGDAELALVTRIIEQRKEETNG